MRILKTIIALVLLSTLIVSCSEIPGSTLNTDTNNLDPNTGLSTEEKAIFLTNLMISSYNIYTAGAESPVSGSSSGVMVFVINNGTTPATMEITYTNFDLDVGGISYLLTGSTSIQNSLTSLPPNSQKRDLSFSGDLEITATNGMSAGTYNLLYVRIDDYDTSTYTEQITGSLAGTAIDYSATGSAGG